MASNGAVCAQMKRAQRSRSVAASAPVIWVRKEMHCVRLPGWIISRRVDRAAKHKATKTQAEILKPRRIIVSRGSLIKRKLMLLTCSVSFEFDFSWIMRSVKCEVFNVCERVTLLFLLNACPTCPLRTTPFLTRQLTKPNRRKGGRKGAKIKISTWLI